MKKRMSALSMSASLLLVGSALITTSQAQASSTVMPSTEAPAEVAATPTFEDLPFAHPVSLESAISVDEAVGLRIVGYHFVSDSITGDFWNEGGLSAEEFLAEIESKTGTAPEVVSAYVDGQEFENRVEESRGFSVPLLGGDLPRFDAPDADPSLAERDRADEDSPVDSSRRATTDTWWPSGAQVMIQPMGDNLAISTKYSWTGTMPYASPKVMADHWGMEFQIDFYSSRVVNSPLPPPHNRPNCGTSTVNYKDWAAASNRPWDWFGWVISGPDYVAAPGNLGLYGDYNDLTDPCKVSSIAVGMANPSQMPQDTFYENFLDIYSYPLKGVEAQSTVGAIVQPVSRAHCEAFPSMPLTDCMGVTPGAYTGDGPSTSRMVLNNANSNKAPSLCWYSGNFGTTPANIWDC